VPMVFGMKVTAHTSLPAGGPELDNRRVIAGVIDLAVVAAGALVIGLAAGLSGAQYGRPGLALSALITAWALYYYFACESGGGGQTLGKRAMKIRVAGVDGRPAGMGQIAVRTLLRVVDGLGLYLVGLIVMLATGERRGRLGDLAARTMIVSAEAAPIRAPAAASPAVAPATISLPTRRPDPAEPEPADADTDTASPALKELARDVAAEPAAEPLPEEEDHVVVSSVETVSAIDLVMEEEPRKPA
jgi:uncharacterized RDD family membrane protein YckC